MEIFSNYFAQQGILGIIILMLIGVVAWQQKRIDTKDKAIADLQEKRKTDTDQYTASYTATTRELVATTRDSVNALNLMQSSINSIANALQNITKK